nr:MAG TPA: hypothetical protein [Caudoviricetes sp.]
MEKLITENRKCIFRKEVYTFHGFYQESNVIPPSPLVGGHSGGVIAYPVAIIETEKGEVLEVEAMKIQFKEDEE